MLNKYNWVYEISTEKLLKSNWYKRNQLSYESWNVGVGFTGYSI